MQWVSGCKILPGQNNAPEKHRCGRNQSAHVRATDWPQVYTPNPQNILPGFSRPLAGDPSPGAPWPPGPPDLDSVGPTVLGYLTVFALREYPGLPSRSPDVSVDTQCSAGAVWPVGSLRGSQRPARLPSRTLSPTSGPTPQVLPPEASGAVENSGKAQGGH